MTDKGGAGHHAWLRLFYVQGKASNRSAALYRADEGATMPVRGTHVCRFDIEGSWLVPAERGQDAPTLGT